MPEYKSGIAPTIVCIYHGAAPLLTEPEPLEPSPEIDELVTEPPEETGPCL